MQRNGQRFVQPPRTPKKNGAVEGEERERDITARSAINDETASARDQKREPRRCTPLPRRNPGRPAGHDHHKYKREVRWIKNVFLVAPEKKLTENGNHRG